MTRERCAPPPPLLAALTGWVALVRVERHGGRALGFLLPTMSVGLLLALAGSGLRVTGLPWYAVATAQVALAGLALNAVTAGAAVAAGGGARRGTRSARSTYVIANGAASLNYYAAPVSQNPTHTRRS